MTSQGDNVLAPAGQIENVRVAPFDCGSSNGCQWIRDKHSGHFLVSGSASMPTELSRMSRLRTQCKLIGNWGKGPASVAHTASKRETDDSSVWFNPDYFKHCASSGIMTCNKMMGRLGQCVATTHDEALSEDLLIVLKPNYESMPP